MTVAEAASESRFLTALADLQAELPKLPKDKTNPHFRSKFTGLDTIVEMVGPLLAKHQLVWMTMPGRDELGPYLEYRLHHIAEWHGGVQGRIPLLLAKDDMQGLGSALTYARRYALSSVLNLVSDEDDDGAAASSYGSAPPSSSAPMSNLQQAAKGLSNDQLIAAYRTVGITAPHGSLWVGLTKIPADQAEAMYAALMAQQNAGQR